MIIQFYLTREENEKYLIKKSFWLKIKAVYRYLKGKIKHYYN